MKVDTVLHVFRQQVMFQNIHQMRTDVITLVFHELFGKIIGPGKAEITARHHFRFIHKGEAECFTEVLTYVLCVIFMRKLKEFFHRALFEDIRTFSTFRNLSLLYYFPTFAGFIQSYHLPGEIFRIALPDLSASHSGGPAALIVKPAAQFKLLALIGNDFIEFEIIFSKIPR